MRVVAVLCLAACALAAPLNQSPGEIKPPAADPGHYEMAKPSLIDVIPEQNVSPELIDGDCADDLTDASLTKGPKVNGGFALNVAPNKKDGARVVANADCAGGRVVDGKCLRPFPRPARTATVQDNMASPEHGTESSYEPDIHQFVKKHFGQVVMEERPPESYHATLPGEAMITNLMNEVSNQDADMAAENLFPTGTNMMTENDEERSVNLNQAMDVGPRRRPMLSPPSRSEKPGSQPAGEWPHVVNSAAPEVIKAPILPATPSDSPSAPTVAGSETEIHVANDAPEAPTKPATPPKLTDSAGEEIAEVGQAAPDPEVEDETFDLQEFVPNETVESITEEPELPPTPTPTPTQNLEELRARQEAEERKTREVAMCLNVLDAQGITCGPLPSEQKSMETGASSYAAMANVQVAAPETVAPAVEEKPAKKAFDPTDLKGNFQSLILDCSKNAAEDLSALSLASNVGAQELSSKRSHLAQQLVKYSTALTCIDSDDFPGCMPSEASATVSKEPVDGKWQCF